MIDLTALTATVVVTTAVVIVVTVIQSLFGVGVLLFGTPLLLLIGHDFAGALMILLPISMSVSLLQIGRHRMHIDRDFFRHVLIFTIPLIVVSLALVTSIELDTALPVGIFLLFVALERYSDRVQRLLLRLVRYQRSYMVMMGVVHGLTNLGGSLLSALVHAKNHPRDVARATIAGVYATFAVFQLGTLAASGLTRTIPWGLIAAYVGMSVVVFGLVEIFVYHRIDDRRYRLLFAAFLAASGILLIGRALFSG